MQASIRIIIAVDTRQPHAHRFTSMIPAHYSINESLYRDGVHFGSQEPPKGAFFHIPGEEPTIAVLKDEQLNTIVHRRFVIITPAGGNGLTLKSFLFPEATTHNFKRNRANETYKVPAGSILLAGDASGALHMSLYCFHAPIQGPTIMRWRLFFIPHLLSIPETLSRCINSSTTYLARIWNAIMSADASSGPAIVTMPARPSIMIPSKEDEGALTDYVILPEPVATLSARIGQTIKLSTAGSIPRKLEIMDALIRNLEHQREWTRIAERTTKRKPTAPAEETPLLKFARLACGDRADGKEKP